MAKTIRPNPVFDRLAAFVGTWAMEAIVDGVTVARATVDFQWFDGGQFLVESTTAEPPLPTTPKVWIENNPNPVTAVIGLDDYTQQFYYVYADVRGVRRVYQMSLEDKVWKFWGQAGPEFHQRFESRFSDDGNTITGRVEQSADGNHWETDFDMRYTKIT